MKVYIVVENNTFKSVELDNVPLNKVFVQPYQTWSNNEYLLIENGIRITWLDYYNDPTKWNCLTIYYRNTIIASFNHIKNPQIVIDALNKYKNISQDELENVYQRKLLDSKSALEIEIDRLKELKLQEVRNIEKYSTIKNKLEELILLITDLEVKPHDSAQI